MLILLRSSPKINGRPFLTPAISPSLTTMWFDSMSFISTTRKLPQSASVKIHDKMIGPVFNTPDISPSATVAYYSSNSFTTKITNLTPSAKVSGLASYNFTGISYYQPALKLDKQVLNLFIPNVDVAQAIGAAGYPIGIFVKGTSPETAVSFDTSGWDTIFMSYLNEDTFTNTTAQPVSFSVS